MVIKYSKKTQGNTKLSPSFKVSEFACQDGSDLIEIDDRLVFLLQAIRSHFGKSVTITSGYRTKAHNASVGGSPNSQHLLGMAADIKVAGVTPSEVAKFAETMLLFGGIGLYGSFTHVDVRASKSRWDQRSGKQVAVSGF